MSEKPTQQPPLRPEQASLPANQAPLPTQLEVLAHLAYEEAVIREIDAFCRKVNPNYPNGLSNLFLMRFYAHVGLLVPYIPSVLGFVATLQAQRWRLDPAKEPAQGDIYVELHDGYPAKVGAIIKVHRQGDRILNDWAIVLDATAPNFRPYRKNFSEIGYILKRPCRSCDQKRAKKVEETQNTQNAA